MRRIFGHYVATSWLVFGAFEAALIAAGSAVAFLYLLSASGYSPFRLTGLAMAVSLGVVALIYSGGLYQGDAVLNLRRTFWRLAGITLPIFALAVWTTGVLARHSVPIYPYRWQWTITLTAGWLFCALVLRVLLRQIYRSGVLTRRVVVLGPSHRVAELAELARESEERFRLVAQLDPLGRAESEAPLESLATLASNLRASEMVVAIGNEPLPWNLLVHCRLAGIRVTDYLDFYEREGRRIRIDSLREDWLALSTGFATKRSRDRLRRFTDIVVAIGGFVATAPVLFFTALAIKLEDGGSILYRQERIGLEGRPFTLLKFRSMREDAESDGTPAWAVERDIRITNVGKIIRKVRIDELPQLWNVLRGDMTLIGPRPERPYFVRQFSQAIPFYDYRHVVRPGITGWAQVSFRYGASLEDTRRKLSYDLYYIKNRGILLDIVVLLRTISVVLRGEGAR